MVDGTAMGAEGLDTQQRRPEKRGQKTIKHEKMDDELWELAKRAAVRQKLGINEWACEAMRAQAEMELGMKPPPLTRDALAAVLLKLDSIERRLTDDKGSSDGPCLLGRLFSEKKRDE
jgi:hypothetical protein